MQKGTVCFTLNTFRISTEEVTAAAKTLWLNQTVADAIAKDSIDIVEKTHKQKVSFFAGKTSRGLVGGLFYLLGYKYDSAKNQKELADHLGTSDVTIRTSYRNWLEEFPDFFQDVVGKLALDQNLRWYVLVDYRRKISSQSYKPNCESSSDVDDCCWLGLSRRRNETHGFLRSRRYGSRNLLGLHGQRNSVENPGGRAVCNRD